MSVELISDMEPPAGLKFNIKGLPPRRAQLAKDIAWRNAIKAEMDMLSKGRRNLEAHISKLEAAVAKANADDVASADSILDKIRRGITW